MINYYLQGGAAGQDDQMIAAMVLVIKQVAAQQSNQEISDDDAMQALLGIYLKALLGDEEATQLFLEILQAAQQLLLGGSEESAEPSEEELAVASARNGAKLNYIKRLQGQCPEGTQMMYFKVGGKVCSKCVAKANKKVSKDCQGFKMEEGGVSPVVNKFKTERKLKQAKLLKQQPKPQAKPPYLGTPYKNKKEQDSYYKASMGGAKGQMAEEGKCGMKVLKKACGGKAKKKC